MKSGCRDGSRNCAGRQFDRGLFANWQVGSSSKPSGQIGAPGLRLEGRKSVSYATRMNRQTHAAPSFSKVSVKSQTVIPREVRERLGLKPGDTLRYRLTDMGVLLDKAPTNEADDPFATFSEWSNAADEKAYGSLWARTSSSRIVAPEVLACNSSAGQCTGRFEFPMKPSGRYIKAVGPGRRTVLEKHSLEVSRIAQRLDHRPRLVRQRRKIQFTDRVVVEPKSEAVASEPINLRNLDHRRDLLSERAELNTDEDLTLIGTMQPILHRAE